MNNGCLIVFEGIDGCGKSTQISLLAQHMANHHADYGFEGLTTTKEPSSNPIGRYVREEIVSGKQKVDAMTEALLFTAARRQHVNDTIKPALTRNHIVLCDRYYHSTFAYQLPRLWSEYKPITEDDLAAMYSWGTNAVEANLTLFIDTEPNSCAQRLAKRPNPDGFDQKGVGYLHQLRQVYRSGIHGCDFYPSYMEMIDGNGTPEEVFASVLAKVQTHITGLKAGRKALGIKVDGYL